MDKLPELRVRFPRQKFHYEPTPGCKYCGGSGILKPRTIKSGKHVGERSCGCLFFGPNTETLVPLIAKSARSALLEMKSLRASSVLTIA